MENKHTPGPWKIQKFEKPETVRFKVLAKKGRRWASVLTGNKKSTGDLLMSEPQAEANARLIAASPDLLEALQAVLNNCLDSQGLADAHKQARAAIAKATGDVQ